MLHINKQLYQYINIRPKMFNFFQQLDEKTFTWEIVVREKVNILRDNDLQMTISCNFSEAERLISSNRYSVERYVSVSFLNTFINIDVFVPFLVEINEIFPINCTFL